MNHSGAGGRWAQEEIEEAKTSMTKMVSVLVPILMLVAGCASETWYLDYGIAASDLNTDKAIIAAANALNSGSRSDIKGAAKYLKQTSMTENQAYLLLQQVNESMVDYSKTAIINSILYHGFEEIAFPYLIKGLQSKSGRVRSNTAKALGLLGCDAKEALPMLRVVSSNDGRGVQESARIAYREISLDCMAKNISTTEPQGN